MSGSGFALGLAISTYEWMAAATLIIVAIFFIPLYLKNKIYTMPQFLSERYNSTVSTIMAIFWLLVYVFVNLTSIIYLGALAITSISGISFETCIAGLAIFSILVTLGGMKVIGYTDVVQVAILIMGGLVTTYLALNLVSEHFGYGQDVWKGLALIREKAPSHFHMIFGSTHPYYKDLPGLSVLIGGMLINNLNYWGCNQYIIQRALGADLKTARSGILFAAFLKLLVPVIAVLPGIAAYVLYQNGLFQTEMVDAAGSLKPDHAYPTLLNLLPSGLKGLAFAALTAAIVASLAGKANSISTIFTLDIYKKAINTEASETRLVWLGRVSVIVSMFLAVVLSLLIGEKLMGEGKQGFQYIQEYTGFVSPGIFAMFILGFFWKKTTSNAALFATIGGFIFSLVLKVLPQLMDLSFLAPFHFAAPNAAGVYEIPFLDRMGFDFIFCVIGMYIITMVENRRGVKTNGLEIDASMFKPSASFTAISLLITGIIAALYTIFW